MCNQNADTPNFDVPDLPDVTITLPHNIWQEVEGGLTGLPTWQRTHGIARALAALKGYLNDRALRTDLCTDCKDESHRSCSLDPACACCQTTLTVASGAG